MKQPRFYKVAIRLFGNW